jgi:hypothetical protein
MERTTWQVLEMLFGLALATKHNIQIKKLKSFSSVAFSPQANFTDRVAAACLQS